MSIKGRTFPEIRIFDLNEIPIKIAPKQVQRAFITYVNKILKMNRVLIDIKRTLSEHERLIQNFKSEFLQHTDFQLIPLHDCPALEHIEFEKRLGKPNIRREDTRVYLAKNHYLELATEPLAEYIELALKSLQDNLRGLSKPDILRMVQVPKEDKVLRAILKYKSDLNKQQAKLEQQRDAIDREIDERIYELYGIGQEERKLIEENF